MVVVPPPYSTHPASIADIEAIWRLMVTVNMAEAGSPGFGLGEIENWLTGDQIVIDEDVLTIRDETGALIGVEIFDSRGPFVRPHAIGGVHPDRVGHGLGSTLLDWAKQRAVDQIGKAPQGARVTFLSFTAAGHTESEQLMRQAGLELVRYFMDMEIDFDGRPALPDIPDGVTIRLFNPATELEVLAQVTQDGFRDHYGFVEDEIDQRVARLRHYMSAGDHDPSLWWVAEDEGRVVGFNLCAPSNEGDATVGYVASLAVLPSHRGRGLGKALLLTAFNEFYRRGQKGAALGVDVDSLTGATRLYEGVGMRPGSRYALWELEIRPGDELAKVE